MSDDPIRERTRLYLITPPTIDDIPLFRDRLLHALDAGDVACLQLRLKSSGEIDEASTQRLAETILTDVQSRGVAVIVNDSVMLAENLLADGVHLGREDGDISEARKRLGTEAIIGATCKSSRHAAMEAGEAGADYVAFGSFYPTTTKADATPASVDVLQFWQEAMTLPCVAIGGITPANAEPLVRAGADFLAVSGGVWSHEDGPSRAVEAFNTLFDRLYADWMNAKA